MQAVTFQQLRVASVFNITEILNVEMDYRMDRHAWAVVKGRLSSEVGIDVIKQELKNNEIALYCGGDAPFFTGILADVEIGYENGYHTATLHALSGTILLDLEEKSRSFQNIKMTWRQLVDSVLADTEDSAAIIPVEIGDVAIGQPVFQYMETDWQFLRRIASRFKTSLLPEMSQGKPKFWIGKPDLLTVHTVGEDLDYSVCVEKRYYDLGGSFENYRKSDFLSYRVDRYEADFRIGESVSFNGQELSVCAMSCQMNDGILLFTYTLALDSYLRYNEFNNQKISGMCLLGTVLQTNAESVKIQLDIDEGREVSVATSYPFPWAPTTGNLMYLMPKVGTRVSLYFGSDHEGSAKAINCIRTNGGIENNTALVNPANRQLLTEHNKLMYLHPGEVGFQTCGEDHNISIVESDLEGILFQSHDSVSILAANHIGVEAKEITVDAASGMIVRNAEVVVDGEALEAFAESGAEILSADDVEAIFDLDMKSALVLMEDDGNYILNVGTENMFSGWEYNQFEPYPDYPRTQKLDVAQIIENAVNSTVIAFGIIEAGGAIGGGIAGAFVGGPAGIIPGAIAGAQTVAPTAAKAAIYGALPYSAAMAAYDLQRGAVSDFSEYLSVAAKGATIMLVTMGIDFKIDKLLVKNPTFVTHVAGSAVGGALGNFSASVLYDALSGDEIDWIKAGQSAFYGAAYGAAFAIYHYGVLERPLPEQRPSLSERWQRLFYEEYLKGDQLALYRIFVDGGIDPATAARLAQWEYPISLGDYLSNYNTYGNPLLFDQNTGKFIGWHDGLTDHWQTTGSFIRKGNKGYVGGHDANVFYAALTQELDDLLGAGKYDISDYINVIPHPTIDGIWEVTYKVPAIDGSAGGKIIPDVFKVADYPKTIYDPDIYSDLVRWATEAMQNPTVDGNLLIGYASNGLEFHAHIDLNTGMISSIYPVL